jgi:hypothetical protein
MDANPRAKMLQNHIRIFFNSLLSMVIYLSTVSYSALHLSFSHSASCGDTSGAVAAYTRW